MMGERFKVGDHATWNSEARHVSGTITKVHKKDFDYKGHTERGRSAVRNQERQDGPHRGS
jgi:hypothetical protein